MDNMVSQFSKQDVAVFERYGNSFYFAVNVYDPFLLTIY